MNVVSMLLC